MNLLEKYLSMACGQFDNSRQLAHFQAERITNYPTATMRTEDITQQFLNLPDNFAGIYIHRKTSYTIHGKTTKFNQFFYITQNGNKIILEALDTTHVDFNKPFCFHEQKRLEKFKPIEYKWKNGCFYGKATNPLTRATNYLIEETLQDDFILLTEKKQVYGKWKFGFDLPIAFRRV